MFVFLLAYDGLGCFAYHSKSLIDVVVGGEYHLFKYVGSFLLNA